MKWLHKNIQLATSFVLKMCAVIIPVACICPDIDGAHIQMELSGVEEISAILVCFQL